MHVISILSLAMLASNSRIIPGPPARARTGRASAARALWMISALSANAIKFNISRHIFATSTFVIEYMYYIIHSLVMVQN